MTGQMPYTQLDPDRILATAVTLRRRVASRFPERGLAKVAQEIVTLSHQTIDESRDLTPPLWWLRALIALIILGGAFLFLSVGSVISLNQLGTSAIQSVESIEAAINTALLASLGLAALIQLESRIKRRRVGRGLHRLRAVIHVIDMHQLTKDPVVFTKGYQATAESPERALSQDDLARYLDYCSELLAIKGKLAALYAQAVNDDGVAQAVNDIETLGSNLSRKIWQKITMIEALTHR
ncbi:hypothetical protein [Neogemmobacter tilapiae]|uniref:Uncharacterized protein n=1 Tax=Neogemmobacter tilapiae TaxID=875041 RepID=A0A918TEM1_9RHOB|nr:hypothetical protein [Gemmobacter tilapiae]GHC45498.1 hypothetical protein GCM10007315_03670 [Gemmobacter tilapiae]